MRLLSSSPSAPQNIGCNPKVFKNGNFFLPCTALKGFHGATFVAHDAGNDNFLFEKCDKTKLQFIDILDFAHVSSEKQRSDLCLRRESVSASFGWLPTQGVRQKCFDDAEEIHWTPVSEEKKTPTRSPRHHQLKLVVSPFD